MRFVIVLTLLFFGLNAKGQIFEKIHFFEPIQDVKYVVATMSSGRQIIVPIVNGIVPYVEAKDFGHYETRDYFYNKSNQHNPNKPLIYKKNEYLETKDIKDELKDLKKSIEDLKKSNIKKQVAPSPEIKK
jgi:hypothetical protein